MPSQGMSTQASYQSERLEKQLRRFIKETLELVSYHLADKQTVLHKDQRSNISKLSFIVEKLTGKPVDEYLKTFTADDAYIPPMPMEELELLIKAVPSDGKKS